MLTVPYSIDTGLESAPPNWILDIETMQKSGARAFDSEEENLAIFVDRAALDSSFIIRLTNQCGLDGKGAICFGISSYFLSLHQKNL